MSFLTPIRRFGASFTTRWLALSGNMRGIIWISVGSLIIALTDGLLKHMGGTFHPVQLSFCRYVMGFLAIGRCVLAYGAGR